MGTNWFMPAFVNRRFGESGMRLEDGTMVCCFDLKKSRNDWRVCELVIPYAMSDYASSFATVSLTELLGAME